MKIISSMFYFNNPRKAKPEFQQDPDLNKGPELQPETKMHQEPAPNLHQEPAPKMQLPTLSDLPQGLPQTTDWIIVGAKATGLDHIQNNLPCQDNYLYESIANGWGIAILADGAGSKSQSHIGSECAVDAAMIYLKSEMRKAAWWYENRLPDKKEWRKIAESCFLTAKEKLRDHAAGLGIPMTELACTLIVAIFGPEGLLIANIGDGRAAYESLTTGWQAAMKPLQGEEPGSTVFITSPWEQAELFGTRVIPGELSAVVLMTDGCENLAFHTSEQDHIHQKMKDANRPNAGFLDPVTGAIRTAYQEGKPLQRIVEKWQRFLKDGHPEFAQETDDKTMIIACNVPRPKSHSEV